MSDLQEDFARALLAQEDDRPTSAWHAQPGFAVYRNTVLKGCVDALEANFPTVARLVGPEWFRSVALAFARACPPQDSRLLTYGDEHFGEFLQAVPTAAGLPWLAGVARLDTLWRACHAAADAPVLAADGLARLDVERLAACCLPPHPATHWAWFADQPVASIWSRERSGTSDDTAWAWAGEGLLLTRADGAVRWHVLPRAGCILLDACREGRPLGDAVQLALASDPSADLVALLQHLLAAGAFTHSLLHEDRHAS